MEDDNTINLLISLNRRWIRRLVVVATTLALVIPTAAWANYHFTDVPNSNPFHLDIDWMNRTGVSIGCNPPDNTKYCPKDNVTREQMAAFLHRLETQGVFADADTVDGLDSTDLRTRFAVVQFVHGSPSMKAAHGLLDWERESAGRYLLTFNRDVSECAWTSSQGNRDNATNDGTSFFTVALHSTTVGPRTIRVQIKDGFGAEVDEAFNVGVHC